MLKNNSLYKHYHTTIYAERNLSGDLRKLMESFNYNYRKFLPENKHAKILDLGCGRGELLLWLETLGYKNLHGLEVSPEMAKLAQANLAQKTITLITDLNKHLSADKNTYALIILNDVLEHWSKTEIETYLPLLYKKLSPGGKLLLRVPNAASVIGGNIRYADYTHQVSFTELSLRQILLIFNFKKIQIMDYSFPANSVLRALRKLGQWKLHLLWKFIYWFEYTKPPKHLTELIFALAEK